MLSTLLDLCDSSDDTHPYSIIVNYFEIRTALK